MNKWNKTVQEIWNKNKHTAGYMFKDALKDAKKVYSSSSSSKKTFKARKTSSRKRKGGKTRKHR